MTNDPSNAAPVRKPLAIGSMTQAQLEAEVMKGLEDIKNGRCCTEDEVYAMLFNET